MTIFVIDAPVAIDLATSGAAIPSEHSLAAPTLLRSQVLALVYGAVRHGGDRRTDRSKGSRRHSAATNPAPWRPVSAGLCMANSCRAQLARYLPSRVHRTHPVAGRRTGYRGPAACRRSAYLRSSRATSRHPEAINGPYPQDWPNAMRSSGKLRHLMNAVSIIRSPHLAGVRSST